jgi:hypothetical protein
MDMVSMNAWLTEQFCLLVSRMAKNSITPAPWGEIGIAPARTTTGTTTQ